MDKSSMDGELSIAMFDCQRVSPTQLDPAGIWPLSGWGRFGSVSFSRNGLIFGSWFGSVRFVVK